MIRTLPLILLTMPALSAFGQIGAVNLRGTVTDSAGTTPVAGATVTLERLGLTTTSGQDGSFALTRSTALYGTGPTASFAGVRDGSLYLSLAERTEVEITAFSHEGRELASIRRTLDAGAPAISLPALGTGLRFFRVKAEGRETLLKAYAVDGSLLGAAGAAADGEKARAALSKTSAAALHDVLTVSKAGFQKAYVSIGAPDSSGMKIRMLKEGSAKFSFFVTSMRTLQQLAGDEKGFGGDLRFGETGPGAGLRGADRICATIAEMSMPGSSVKGWRAFLSATADAHGNQVDAIDRVGPGPWYDRVGRLLAPTKADLLNVRPANGDPTIQLDLPNEWGIPNHRPDPSKPAEDNHHMITGSGADGKLLSESSTCKDWTTADGSSANGKPAYGFAWPRGGRVGSMGSNWMATGAAPGCGAGIEIIETGPGSPTATFIGSGGGYGGFYCFALVP
jgi:hypothetical protein